MRKCHLEGGSGPGVRAVQWGAVGVVRPCGENVLRSCHARRGAVGVELFD